jgi:hypothetical protein
MKARPKDVSDKLKTVLSVWKDLRPAKSFAGMTLAEFKAAVQPSLDARAQMDALTDQMTAALVNRNTADAVTKAKLALVVNAVKGDPAEGEDGELYTALGYVRKSARKTGKTNKARKAATAK